MRKAIAAIFKRTETSLAAVIVIVSLFFSFSSPYFLTLSNASDLIEAYSVTTILAAGVFVVLVSGGIDISFAAVASVTQYHRRDGCHELRRTGASCHSTCLRIGRTSWLR